MSESSPHEAFRDAYKFVQAYFEQSSRLLSDAASAMSKRGYLTLRPFGDGLSGGMTPSIGDAETWLAQWLFTFYAPAEAFGGKRYGASPAAVKKVPFIGLGFHGPEPELPAIYLGWIEEVDGPEDTLEKRVPRYFQSIEPSELEPMPEPSASLSEVSWIAAAHRKLVGTRVALARIPMALITRPQHIDELVDSLHSSLVGRR